MNTENNQLSFGEQLVGITFNPSNDDKVFKAKSLFAELANMVNDESKADASYLFNLVKGGALKEIINAQMNVVKLLTLKY